MTRREMHDAVHGVRSAMSPEHVTMMIMVVMRTMTMMMMALMWMMMLMLMMENELHYLKVYAVPEQPNYQSSRRNSRAHAPATRV